MCYGRVYLFRKRSLKSAFIVAGAVLSHWLLDLVTHRPDLPLYPGSDIMMGFGLWNSPIWTILIEGGLFTAAIFLYVRTTGPINKKGVYGLWSLVVFLFIVWLINFFSPPPPNETALAYSALILWLLVPWGYWIDKNRSVKE